MQATSQQEKKPPTVQVVALIAGGLAVALFFTLMPWNLVPSQVTEDVAILAVTEHGCVGESRMGVSVVIEGCEASVGDVVPATFFVPAMEQNGYYDRIEAKLSMVQP